MPNPASRDILQKQIADMIEVSLEMCCSSHQNLTQSETAVLPKLPFC